MGAFFAGLRLARYLARERVIALYLIAAHLIGDFVLQTRWQAARKLTDYNYRARHVGAYCVPFLPIAAWRVLTGHVGIADGHAHAAAWALACFLVWLAVLHFFTDSRRFRSTLGDWLVWSVSVWLPSVRERSRPIWTTAERQKPMPTLAANPWAPLPIVLDQALHVAQLAVLGGLFLS